MRRLLFVLVSLLCGGTTVWAQDRPLSPVVDRAILRAMAENAAGSLPASILPTPLMILAAAQPAVVTPLTPIANLRGRTDANGYLLVRVVIDDSGGGGACSLPTCTGTLGATQGGTGITTYTLGDTLYASAANTLAKLAGNTTTTRKFLRQTGDGVLSAAPAWDTILAADVPASALTAANDTNVTLTLGGTPASSLLTAASITAGWTGTLAAGRLNSSVVHSVINDTNVTGSIAAQALTLGWTGQLAISRGGTGQSTATTAFNALSPTTTLGDVSYHDGTDDVRLAGNITATKNFFTQTGTGAVSAAPAWGTIAAGDLPSHNAATATALAADPANCAANNLAAGINASGTAEGCSTFVASITGTANQVIASASTGAVTLSTPQDIATASSVTFGNVTLGTGGALRTSTSAGNTVLLQARDVDGGAYTTFGTLTANNTPTFDLDDATTKAGAYIYRAGGTDVAVADGGTNSSTALNNSRIMVSSAGAIVEAGAMTNGQLLIGSTGAAPVVAAITAGSNITVTNGAGSITIASTGGSSTPSHIVTTEFVTAGKFTDISASGGSISFVNAGLQMTTGPAAGEKAGADWSTIGPAVIVNGSPTFSCRTTITTLGTDIIVFWGLGSPPVTGSFTTAHVGFKLTRSASGTANVFATQADGTTENASSALTAVVQGDKLELIAVVNGTTSADYYWRLNDGALSSATNLTTNLPTTSTGVERFYVSNAGIATTDVITVLNATYKR